MSLVKRTVMHCTMVQRKQPWILQYVAFLVTFFFAGCLIQWPSESQCTDKYKQFENKTWTVWSECQFNCRLCVCSNWLI